VKKKTLSEALRQIMQEEFPRVLKEVLAEKKQAAAAQPAESKKARVLRIIKEEYHKVLKELYQVERGDKVKFNPAAKPDSTANVPAHSSFTRVTKDWKGDLVKIKGKTGTVKFVYSNGDATVDFGNGLVVHLFRYMYEPTKKEDDKESTNESVLAEGNLKIRKVPSEASKALFQKIKNGTRVTIITSVGQTATGRAVMYNRDQVCWVLNMGGAHGRPGIVDARNIYAIGREVASDLMESTRRLSEATPVDGAFNKKVRGLAKALMTRYKISPSDKDRFLTFMYEAVYAGFEDANFHSGNKRLGDIFTNFNQEFPEARKIQQIGDKFGVRVSQLSEWSPMTILDAFSYILSMEGYRNYAERLEKLRPELEWDDEPEGPQENRRLESVSKKKAPLNETYVTNKEVPAGIRTWVKNTLGKDVQRYKVIQKGTATFAGSWHEGNSDYYQAFKLVEPNDAVPATDQSIRVGGLDAVAGSKTVTIPSGYVLVRASSYPPGAEIYTASDSTKFLAPQDDSLSDEEKLALGAAKSLKPGYRPKFKDSVYQSLIQKGYMAANKSITVNGRNVVDGIGRSAFHDLMDRYNKEHNTNIWW
jgi:hypothetical protein